MSARTTPSRRSRADSSTCGAESARARQSGEGIGTHRTVEEKGKDDSYARVNSPPSVRFVSNCLRQGEQEQRRRLGWQNARARHRQRSTRILSMLNAGSQKTRRLDRALAQAQAPIRHRLLWDPDSTLSQSKTPRSLESPSVLFPERLLTVVTRVVNVHCKGVVVGHGLCYADGRTKGASFAGISVKPDEAIVSFASGKSTRTVRLFCKGSLSTQPTRPPMVSKTWSCWIQQRARNSPRSKPRSMCANLPLIVTNLIP